MAKVMRQVSFRWEPDFVERLQLVAGPRGMQAWVREAIEQRMGRECGPQVPVQQWNPQAQGRVVQQIRQDTNFDEWGA